MVLPGRLADAKTPQAAAGDPLLASHAAFRARIEAAPFPPCLGAAALFGRGVVPGTTR